MKAWRRGALVGCGIAAVIAITTQETARKAPEWLQAGPYRLQVARTPEERSRGLQGATRLPLQTGMIFIQPKGEPAIFWMKGCLAPLDIIFIGEGGAVQRMDRAVPLLQGEAPIVYTALGPMSPLAAENTALPETKYVVEVAAGEGSSLVLQLKKRYLICG